MSEINSLIRDPEAIAAIEATVKAMTTNSAKPINDYSILGSITEEHGHSVSAPATFEGVGSDVASAKLTLHDGDRTVTTRGELGLATQGNSESNVLPASISLESPQYFFAPLLIGVLSNPTVGARYIRKDGSQEIHVQISRRSVHWKPHMEFLDTGVFDVYINPTTHLVDEIGNDSKTPASILRPIKHYVTYSDYRPEEGWIVPHAVQESYVGGKKLTIVLNSFSFNTGLKVESFSITPLGHN
jgi:hypothetical protein